jgi:transposase
MQDGKPMVDLRQIMNALRFKVRIIGGWGMLPVGFGPPEVVHWWFRRLLRRLLLRIVQDIGTMIQESRAKGAVAPLIVSHDPPRHSGRIVIDRCGRLHLDNLAVTEVAEHSGSRAILDAIIERWAWGKRLLGDGPNDRSVLVSKPVLLEFLHEVTQRIATEPDVKGAVQETATRHNADRLMRWRQVIRQYEARLDISDTPAWPWETY